MTLSNTVTLISELLDKLKKLMKNDPESRDWDYILFKEEI